MSDDGIEPTPVPPPDVRAPRRNWGWRLVVIAVTLGALAVPVVALLLRADPEGGDRGGPTEEREEALTFLHPDSPEALPIQPDSAGALFLEWNTQGTALAYIKGADIWVLEEDGTTRNLTETPTRVEGLPRWSPDGTTLAFASRAFLEGEEPEGLIGPPGALTVMDRDGSGYEVVGERTMLWPPSWSREGRRIAYATGSTLEVFDPRSGDARSFTPAELGLDRAAYLGGPVWSPRRDEVVVYFSESDTEPTREQLIEGTAPAVAQGFARVTPGGGAPTVLFEYEAPFLAAWPAQWSPNGTTVLVNLASSPIQDNPVGVWLIDRKEGTPRRIEGVAAYQVAWSPSGDRIAYVELDERSIVLIDSESLEVVAQPGPEGGVEGIAWRPGGGDEKK